MQKASSVESENSGRQDFPFQWKVFRIDEYIIISYIPWETAHNSVSMCWNSPWRYAIILKRSDDTDLLFTLPCVFPNYIFIE